MLFCSLATTYVISIPTDFIRQKVPEEQAHFKKHLFN